MFVRAMVVFVILGGSAQGAEPPNYTYWTGNTAPGRLAYELAVVQAALEKTRDTYGDYRLSLDDTTLPPMRGRHALLTGELFDFVATTIWDYESNLDELAVIPYPISYGLLGYRRLLVHADHVSDFIEADIDYLKDQLAGQGVGWPDLGVYEDNHLPVDEVATFDNLWPMLVSGRIDYVPLGVEETEPTLEHYGQRYPQVAKVPDLLLHYSMPVYLVVCSCRPQLVRRLTEGMRRLSESGELWTLFLRYKSDALERLNSGQPRVIELKNTHLPDIYQPQGEMLLKAHNH